MIFTILWIGNILLFSMAIYMILQRIKNINKQMKREALKAVNRIENRIENG